jgi:hypothetical protein
VQRIDQFSFNKLIDFFDIVPILSGSIDLNWGIAVNVCQFNIIQEAKRKGRKRWAEISLTSDC